MTLSLVPDPRRIADLQRELDAANRTVEALMTRLEDVNARRGSAFATLTQNIALERVISNKTAELEEQRSRLETALRELQLTQARLLQAQKLEAIGQLAAGIAHEVNTPAQYVTDNVSFLSRAFASLVGATEPSIGLARRLARGEQVGREEAEEALASLKKAKLDYLLKQIPRAVEQSLDGLDKVSSIVRAMKAFSHPSGAEMEPVELGEVVRTATTVARNEWKYVADLEVDVDEGVGVVPCIRTEISQVVLNLVVNAGHAVADAVAASGERGRIDVRVRREDRGVVIEVSDTGCGIPESARAKVFDPFFTTKPVGKGTGQGLAIAYSAVVDKHGGRISFETETGKGTTFRVWLPDPSSGGPG